MAYLWQVRLPLKQRGVGRVSTTSMAAASRLSIGLPWVTASCLDHVTLAQVVVIMPTHSMGDGRLGGRRAAAGRDAGVSEVATADDGRV